MTWRKYGTDPKLDKLVNDEDWHIRVTIAEQSYGLDKLINNRNWQVREACIKSEGWLEFCNNNWETLINSKYDDVREAVAQRGYGLNILINDANKDVREACIESSAWPEFCKNNWETLIYNDYWVIREAVAIRGYGLDKLISDVDEDVRIAVAQKRYGLDILVNDENWEVRRAVALQCYGLDKLIYDEDDNVRRVVAYYGYRLDKLIYDNIKCVRDACIENREWWSEFCDSNWETLVNSKYTNVREAVAIRGYGLNRLIDDEDIYVHDAVKRYLKNNGYKSIDEWIAKNPNKVYGGNHQVNPIIIDIKNFISKIEASSKLKIQLDCDSIDEFFAITTFKEPITLTICTVDTKKPIIKIQKIYENDMTNFKCIVDIVDENGDYFSIKTTIKSKEQLDTKINEIIESLKLHKEFSKYVYDLENCI